jgi:hypothetical protein
MNGSDNCRWDDDLEGISLRIAGLDHTPIRVMAGPGTGKTFALMRRIVWSRGRTLVYKLTCVRGQGVKSYV